MTIGLASVSQYLGNADVRISILVCVKAGEGDVRCGTKGIVKKQSAINIRLLEKL